MCDAIAAELISFSLASVRHVVDGADRCHRDDTAQENG